MIINKYNKRINQLYQINFKIIIIKKTRNHHKTIKDLHKLNLLKTLKIINN